jgi:hypothetical protein
MLVIMLSEAVFVSASPSFRTMMVGVCPPKDMLAVKKSCQRGVCGFSPQYRGCISLPLGCRKEMRWFDGSVEARLWISTRIFKKSRLTDVGGELLSLARSHLRPTTAHFGFRSGTCFVPCTKFHVLAYPSFSCRGRESRIQISKRALRCLQRKARDWQREYLQA